MNLIAWSCKIITLQLKTFAYFLSKIKKWNFLEILLALHYLPLLEFSFTEILSEILKEKYHHGNKTQYCLSQVICKLMGYI